MLSIKNFAKNLICKELNKQIRLNYSSDVCQSDVTKKVCIVGAGPAGFYAAQYILKQLQNCDVDIIERLPVPFGLVRFGVAPDHPEVKNVINTFSKTAENPRFRFIGNLSLGKDITLQELREKYHAVLLTYGAEKDRKLGIPNEDTGSVISARKFVAWYNGLPGSEKLNPNLKSKHVTLVGQGNVAIDVARILLKPVDTLKNTDITSYALEALSRSKVEKVYLVGRRGPLQAAFTIKELREMLKLKNVDTVWREHDFDDVRKLVPELQRPRKRILELMLSDLDSKKEFLTQNKQFVPIFFRSPKSICQNDSVDFFVNGMIQDKAQPTNDIENVDSKLTLRSIGYKAVRADDDISFDEEKGQVLNDAGRVLMANCEEQPTIDVGLYVAGWLGTGPTGVILTTMNGAFSVAKTMCDDMNTNTIDCTESKPGLDISGKNVVTWKGWQKIDKAEMKAGVELCKPREKIVSIKEMLKIAEVL